MVVVVVVVAAAAAAAAAAVMACVSRFLVCVAGWHPSIVINLQFLWSLNAFKLSGVERSTQGYQFKVIRTLQYVLLNPTYRIKMVTGTFTHNS